MGYREHDLREKLEAVGEARRTGSMREAARGTGTPFESIRRWCALFESGLLYDGVGKVRLREEDYVREYPRDPAELPDDPEELKRIIFEQQFEIDLMKTVVDVVKKGPSVDLSTLTNREKAAVIDAMRETYSLSFLASELEIPLSTYYYNRAALRRPDKYAGLRGRIRAICEGHRLTWGYRRVKLELEHCDEPEVRSEKVVLALMRDMGLLAVPPRAACYSSYSAADDSSELPNVPLNGDGTHDFSAPAPNSLWLTDVTEMRIPAGRAYLSPVLDCFDGAIVGWKVSQSASSAQLTDPSLEQACAQLREGDAPVVHSDRGSQYHASSWAGICAANGISRSMSRKGHSPDNARMEGFFGLLKREFFHCRDWEGVSIAGFCAELDAWLRWYNEGRRTSRLGWKSPMEYRRSLGLTA